MTFVAEAAGFHSLCALSGAATASAAFPAKCNSFIQAHIAVRAVYAVTNRTCITVAAVLTNIHVIDAFPAVKAMHRAAVAEAAGITKFVDTLAAFFTVMLIIAAAIGVRTAMIASVADPVVADELAAIFAVRLRLKRKYRCCRHKHQHHHEGEQQAQQSVYFSRHSLSSLISSKIFKFFAVLALVLSQRIPRERLLLLFRESGAYDFSFHQPPPFTRCR